ncbi:MAG: hypothetical protein MJ130_11425, partial [Lachnospiraceae bacterium]|nr:hypothetical protein [Lachnospiraceae bacterium]
ILVNGTPANVNTRVYEDFTLDFSVKEAAQNTMATEEVNEADVTVDAIDTSELNESDEVDERAESNATVAAEENSEAEESDNNEPVVHSIQIVANGKEVVMSGKKQYVFVDVFDYIDFDLRNPAGRNVVTLINGENAEYMKPLNEGDVLEIYWK